MTVIADAGPVIHLSWLDKLELLSILFQAGARAAAQRRGLAVTVTPGVLRAARDRWLIDGVLPLLLELRRLGQWFSAELEAETRREESGDA